MSQYSILNQDVIFLLTVYVRHTVSQKFGVKICFQGGVPSRKGLRWEKKNAVIFVYVHVCWW